ncbi:nucleotidyl transferase AbiEii/AbiGii toxin family protein [[Actinomadura] parvosata]|uniref:nucleotidyl transferase AbiEii/AbiGii toxin family protein n=1 Tax=[Actinomadura] parvosata TaxID=1955412 RepID=UPI00406D1E2E
MYFPPFQERLLQAVAPVCERYGLVLAGGYAIKAHGFTDRPSKDLDFATAEELPLAEVVAGVIGAFQAAGLQATIISVSPRSARLMIEDPQTGEECEFDLLREAFQQHPATCGELRVLSVEDAIGLKIRALHERSYARDIIDVAAVGHLYTFRGLEGLAKPHNDYFSIYELATRLSFVDSISDEEFESYGLGEEQIRQVRRFAQAWLQDIQLRRADDGDADYDHPDLPEID